ncbi:MAG: putative S-layer associated protein [Firmicutes bacterium]|nr:putative S-layer associated protein [Bacillota bacterium]
MRKLTAIMLAGALTLSALAPTALADNTQRNQQRPQYEQDFKDWQSDFWANESLARMITRGVIQGNGDATIASYRSVTRLEAAIMMSRLLELQAPEIPTGHSTVKASWGEIQVTNTTSEFTIRIKTSQGEFTLADGADIPEWGRKAILAGLREGFVVFDGASLSPMKALTRLEAAIMMVKAAGLDAQAQARAGASLDFKDADKIPARLRGYVAIAVESGFVTGYEDGTFQPGQILTRAEWAALLDRLDRAQGAPVTADGRQIKATVTAVSNGAVAVTTPVYPGGVTYRVAVNAVIYSGGKEIALADIHADDQVIINLNSTRQILLLTVTNVKRQVSGTVEAFVSASASVTGSIRLSGNGSSRTYTVNSQTRVILGGQTATFADVRTGDQVTLKLDGSVVKEIAIKAAAGTVAGTLQAVSFGSNTVLPSVTVRSSNQAQATYSIADYAVIKAANGTAITLGDLNVGDELTLKTERDLVVAIQVKAMAPVRIATGQVEAFVSATASVAGAITIRENGVATTYTVTSGTAVLVGGKKATFADVRIGDRVNLKLDGSRATQIAIKVDTATVTGALVAVDPGTNLRLPTIELTGTNIGSTSYTIADHATVKAENGRAVTLRDLHVGDQLTLKVERNLVTAIQVKVSVVKSVSGKVDAFVSPTASVTGAVAVRTDNSSATYSVTGSTEVRLDGKKVTFADIRVGDQVTLMLDGARVTQIAITAEKFTIMGKLQIVAMGGGSIQASVSIKDANGVTMSYMLADRASIKAANGATIRLQDLHAGDSLSLSVERNLVTAIRVQ